MILKEYPKRGVERSVRTFALFPTCVEGKKIWLEYYYENQWWGVRNPYGPRQDSDPNQENNYWCTFSKTFEIPDHLKGNENNLD